MQPYQLNSTDWIKQELAGLLGEQVTRDINDIIRLYSLYDGDGQRWQVETEGLDYTPTVKVTNIIAELIGKEKKRSRWLWVIPLVCFAAMILLNLFA